MTISTTMPTRLSNPKGSDRVPVGTLGYFQARNKRRAYTLVMREFKKSKLSQADLARRLGKGTDVVCRLLSGPANWTLDTISDLLFAISGATPDFNIEHPLSRPPRNQTGPVWLYEGAAIFRRPEPRTEAASAELRIRNQNPRPVLSVGST